ncbi:membrane protein PF10097 family [Clostridium sp. CAG:277]|jgi:Predicted membrane protein|nr:membrane protein PF10097 family [Clostridium sp. CAG:277]
MKQFSSLQETIQDNPIEDDAKEISEISDIIDKSDIQEEDKERIIACIRREEFAGPLPHPAILKQYDEIQPGFAQEILKMVTDEQGHRHKMESMLIKSQTSLYSGKVEVLKTSMKLKIRLQIFGFVSTFFLLVIGAVCIFEGKNIGSIAPFILAIGSFCWTMFYGKKSDEEDYDEEESDEERSDDKNRT